MKKRLLSIAFVAAIAVTAGWNFAQSENKVNLCDLALANVEALAESEGGSTDCSTYCKSDYRYTCIISYGNGTDGVTCFEQRRK